VIWIDTSSETLAVRCKLGETIEQPCSDVLAHTSSETLAVRCKLGETIEQPCSDVLAHTLEVCKGACLYNEYLAIQDGHDSWGMCTTSTECKTILTVMLTVMSGMDPHMIR
jgi:hypothetical protein